MKSLTLLAGLSAGLFATAALAQDITVTDAYARASGPAAQSGAIFMLIENHGATDDRLIAAATDAAERVELHTHLEDANGVMRMVELEDGMPIAAGGTHELARGGDHVMLLGLTRPLTHGDTLDLTLTFEVAGEVEVEIPVDLERMPQPRHGHGHGVMMQGN